ncbi:MAG: hypothetical protein K9M45_12255, partial [Kiritimatiellales bacterium]|nr:hypothetical protein [Kiritimatiellales bacterium]
MKTTHAIYKRYGMLFAVCFSLMTAMADKGSGQTAPNEIPPQAWSWPMTAEPQTPAKPAKSGLKNGGHWQGMPLGGLGTGGITRDYHGAFVRWTLKAGDIKFFCEPANMFAVRQRVGKAKPVAHPMYPGYPGVRPLKNPPKKKSLASWGWDFSGEGCTYHALFPKAWNEYPATSKEPVAMTCEQFSPVLPNNYRESSYPVSVFVWHLENTSDQPVETSILFSMVNMVGWFDQFGGGKPGRANAGNVNRAVRQVLPESGGTFKGVVFERESSIQAGHALTEGDGQFCILAKESDRCKVTYLASFETNGDGREAWEPFVKNGALSDDETAWVCGPSRQVAGAVCATVTLAPGEKLSVPMALAWDLPIVAFGSGREHWRQYTKYFGREGRHAREIAGEALSNWQDWSRKIDAWHESVISRRRVPDWLYGMLFNEAYLIVDGYTVWTDGTLEHPGEDPFFGIIECPDYPFYCTLDLWVYGSFIFAEYWPELEKNVLRRFSRSILREDSYLRRVTSTGEKYISNAAGPAPHDFGQPEEDPPFSCNSYTHRNPNRWKD